MTNEFFGIIESWIASVLPNLSTIMLKNQYYADSPKPDKPYGVINIRFDEAHSSTPYIYCSEIVDPENADNVLQYHSWQRKSTLVVDIYDTDAINGLAKLQLSLHFPTIQTLFRENDIAISNIGNILDTTELREVAHDPSAQVEFALSYIGESTEGTPWIDEINVELDLGS